MAIFNSYVELPEGNQPQFSTGSSNPGRNSHLHAASGYMRQWCRQSACDTRASPAWPWPIEPWRRGNHHLCGDGGVGVGVNGKPEKKDWIKYQQIPMTEKIVVNQISIFWVS